MKSKVTMMEEKTDNWLSINEISQYLGVSSDTIYK